MDHGAWNGLRKNKTPGIVMLFWMNLQKFLSKELFETKFFNHFLKGVNPSGLPEGPYVGTGTKEGNTFDSCRLKNH